VVTYTQADSETENGDEKMEKSRSIVRIKGAENEKSEKVFLNEK